MTRNIVAKAIKLWRILGQPSYATALACYRVAAGVEHEPVLRHLGDVRSVVDIGANRGQFALMARNCYPKANIISFEPLPEAAQKFGDVFLDDHRVVLHNVAVGPRRAQTQLYVAQDDDSSSLLPIGPLQQKLFPQTALRRRVMVPMAPLSDYLEPEDIVPPALLKLDVQGFELEALRGCEPLLDRFAYIYVECSFVELYAGQALVDEVIDWLQGRGFGLTGVYNMQYDQQGAAIQGDCLFARERGDIKSEPGAG